MIVLRKEFEQQKLQNAKELMDVWLAMKKIQENQSKIIRLIEAVNTK